MELGRQRGKRELLKSNQIKFTVNINSDRIFFEKISSIKLAIWIPGISVVPVVFLLHPKKRRCGHAFLTPPERKMVKTKVKIQMLERAHASSGIINVCVYNAGCTHSYSSMEYLWQPQTSERWKAEQVKYFRYAMYVYCWLLVCICV